MAYRALAPGKRIAYIYDGGYPLFQDSGESATALRQACIGPREDRSAFHGTVSVERERQETAGPTGIPAARAGLENHLSNGRRHSLDRRHRPKRGSVSGETMTVQIIEVAGNRMAVLPEDEYRRLLDVVEDRSEEHTSELKSLMSISYAIFCLKKKNKTSA